jgi:hypothetical protein
MKFLSPTLVVLVSVLDARCSTGLVKTVQLTAIIEREGDGYVALCPDVDVASQGASIDEARANLQKPFLRRTHQQRDRTHGSRPPDVGPLPRNGASRGEPST